jgi:hypothetical protein
MKYSVLTSKENIVYAYAECHVDTKEEAVSYHHSLELNEEAINLGCKLIMVDEKNLPIEYELGSCYYDDTDKKFKFSNEKKEWQEISNLRAERMQEFEIGDKYQLPYLQANLTENQKLEYDTWRKAWLDVTETKVKPNRPTWMK